MKSRPRTTSDDTPAGYSESDARRIARLVLAYESSKRNPSGSKLPRAVGGSSDKVRLAKFSGQWRNEAPNNVKTVTLQKPVTLPYTWSADGTVQAINWLSHVPTYPGVSSQRWCAVVPITGAGIWLLIAAEC